MNSVFRTITLPAAAGGVAGLYAERIRGRFFYVVSATASFQVEPDSQGKLTVSTGTGFGSATAPRFHRLTLTNATAAAITISFYAGDEEFKGSAVSVAAATETLETITPGGANLSNASANYTGKRGVSVYNSGATNITAAGVTITPGLTAGWSVDGRYQVLASITVDCTGGGAALVTFTS